MTQLLPFPQNRAYQGQLLLREAELCDRLRRYSYPKMATYQGWFVKKAGSLVSNGDISKLLRQEGQLIDLCFIKPRRALKELVQDDPRPLEKGEYLQDIEAGMRHLS